jgi:hypothetical protein
MLTVKNTMKSSRLYKNEQGLAAIIVTIFFMTMLSVIVLAFSQTARREQVQSLDRQLSRQSFYSSESAINKRIKDIRDGTIVANKDDSCDPSENVRLDSGDAVGYTCILHDKSPADIQVSMQPNQSEFYSLNTAEARLGSITVSWKNKADDVNRTDYCPANGSASSFFTLPKSNDYRQNGAGTLICSAGIVRLQLMKFQVGQLNQDQLYNNTQTLYLRPTANPAPSTTNFTVDPGSGGSIIPASCNAEGCTVTINGIGVVDANSKMYAQIRMLYQPGEVEISGRDGIDEVHYNEAQIKVDVTAKSQNAQRRVQVRVPYSDTTLLAREAVMSSSDVCKRIQIFDNKTENAAECGGASYFN